MKTRDRTTRSIETSVTVDAPPALVWRALVEAEELTNWFPLEAEVEPGLGGWIALSWGAGECAQRARITAWEPGRRLALAHRQGEGEQALEITEEYVLLERAGKTVVRLVHAGFGTDASWDHLYDGTVRGWDFELRGLKHYLERHRGERRRVVHVAAHFTSSLAEAWERLLGPRGLTARGTLPAEPGARFAVTTATDLPLEGTVVIHRPPLDLAALVSNWNDAYLRVRIDESYSKAGERDANLWLSTYGLAEDARERLRAGCDRLVAELAG